MDLIALPLLLVLLFMWVPGLRLAAEAVRTDDDRKTPAVVAIGVGVCAVVAVGFGAPLLFLDHEPLNMWKLLSSMTLEYTVAASVAWNLILRFRSSRKRPFLIGASTLFIAAGLYPITWFTIIGPLVSYFDIHRTG
ncbi:MAG: hypothetical protein ABIZ04_15815 [Opitutus sp.]